MKTYLIGNRFIACIVVICSAFILACSSSATATKTVETPEEKKLRIERARESAWVRHLGKTFPKSSNVEAVYDAQNLSSQKYEVFGEILVLLEPRIEVDEIEGVMLSEALDRGADAVLLQDLSLSGSLGRVSVRGRLIKFK